MCGYEQPFCMEDNKGTQVCLYKFVYTSRWSILFFDIAELKFR